MSPRWTMVFSLAVSGCAVLPNSVRPEFEHMSHATQHWPFTSSPSDYGANLAVVIVHWDAPLHTYLEIGEGLDLDRHWNCSNSNGEIMGPREQFTARIGYVFTVPK